MTAEAMPKKAPKAGAAKTERKPKPAAKASVAKKDVIQRLRIRVRAYEYKILDTSVKQIMDTAIRYDAEVVGPIPLPTEIKKYTVNRAAFIYKNTREQFEMRIHKRLIDIINPSAKIIESLSNLSLPSGVTIDVKSM
ncbi:MAG: rpsJ [Candidatus Paceibacter sp.]|jgi:small subunit ribosomal protein S10|nr:rpsJ [Candidatus Paceibacter sp.]